MFTPPSSQGLANIYAQQRAAMPGAAETDESSMLERLARSYAEQRGERGGGGGILSTLINAGIRMALGGGGGG